MKSKSKKQKHWISAGWLIFWMLFIPPIAFFYVIWKLFERGDD